MPIPVIAIFDIGKTNKKFILFDSDLNLLLHESMSLEEISDEDGFPSEDLFALTHWVLNRITLLNNDGKYALTHLNFTTYGASMVHLDDQLQPIGPLYNYLKPMDPAVLTQFEKKHGNLDNLSLATASPVLGFLNAGLQLFNMKLKQPDLFNKVSYSIFLPQYLNFLFTQKMITDFTCLGCHTFLWNYIENRYHEWVKKEGFINHFPLISESGHSDKILINGNPVVVGTGVHDSSSALYAYLNLVNGPFVLISTGTWSISLNKFNTAPLTKDMLEKDCLNFLDPTGQQVRASRLLLGKELSYQLKQLKDHFQVSVKEISLINYEPGRDKEIRTNTYKYKYINPSLFGFSEPDKTDYSIFPTVKEAYHQLMLEMVQLQIASMKLVIGDSHVKSIYIDGGFVKNDLFMQLMANSLKDFSIYSISIPQGTAIGAAIMVNSQLNLDNFIKNKLKVTSISAKGNYE